MGSQDELVNPAGKLGKFPHNNLLNTKTTAAISFTRLFTQDRAESK